MNYRADNLFPRKVPNLKRSHLDAIRRLKQDQTLVIVDSDKNLGPVAIDTDVYRARVSAEMADT